MLVNDSVRGIIADPPTHLTAMSPYTHTHTQNQKYVLNVLSSLISTRYSD